MLDIISDNTLEIVNEIIVPLLEKKLYLFWIDSVINILENVYLPDCLPHCLHKIK